jgi:hypothetical protein
MYAITSMLCACAVASGLWFAVARPGPAPAPQQGNPDRQVTGKVLEVWVSAPGRVQFRLQGTDDKGKAVALWFETPADKDINTLFENLALGVVRQSIERGTDLTVQAKDSSGDDGTVLAKAFEVVRLGFRVTN